MSRLARADGVWARFDPSATAGQGVVFASEGDHRLSRSPLGSEGRAQPANIPSDAEALRGQKIRLQLRGFEFQELQLGIVPNLI